ncbi:MAG: PAS domain S-box protein [Candidatus Bathyarchaeota archaeon]|jgi:PAS domain S-box-containing protein
MISGFEDIQIQSRIAEWGPLPVISAILIAVLSNLLRQKDFRKPFKIFLLILTTSAVMMLLPLPVSPQPALLYPVISAVTIVASGYLIWSRRKVPDLMFLLAMICFTLAEVKGIVNSGIEFVVFAYTCAHIFLALVFVTARESEGSDAAAFFALEKEYEKTKQELEISRDQLTRAKYNFKSLVNVIADPVVIVDHKGHFLEINDKAAELTGFSKEELLGKNFVKTDIVPAKSKAILLQNLAKRMMGVTVKPYEIEVNKKSGGTLHVALNAQKIEYEDKSADLVVFHDITERKMMEERLEKYAEQLEEKVKERTKTLKENEEKLLSIFNSSPDAIAVSDLKGNIVECNQATLDFLGFSKKDEIIGKNSSLFIAKKDQQKVKKSMKNVLKGDPLINVEYAAVNKEGYEFPAEFSTSAIKDHSGNPTGFVTITNDITERKRMENELRRYSEQLEELVEERTEALKQSQERFLKTERLAAIGQAATMVGHDLRNPLQAIENGIYYINTELSKRPNSQNIKETLQAIHGSVEYADNIVKDLQSFASKREPLFKKIDINTLVKETFSHVKTPENVETIIELGELPKIEADKDMMGQIFVNLAVNGIQAMKEKRGILKVSTKETNGFIEIKFQDTGTGIKKENMPKIFIPFFTTKAQGMGVGLPICKRFIELHDGNIEVESEEDEGSIFTVKLPIQRNGGGKT